MTGTRITDTFKIAATVICQQKLDGEISFTEAEARVKRAERLTLIERLQAMGLHVPRPWPGWMRK